jgi:hypothetical protein
MHPADGTPTAFTPATTGLEALTVHKDRKITRHPIIGWLTYTGVSDPDEPTWYPAVVEPEMAFVIAAPDLDDFWAIRPAGHPLAEFELDFAIAELHQR